MSFGTSSNCALCTRVPSTTSCEGCRRKFCPTCLSTHRDELLLEFEDLVNYRNELVEIINNNLPNNTTGICPCFDEINRWENEMHTNIDRIAAAARDNVREFLSIASKNVRNEFDRISQDLQQRQKTGAYIEGDLNRIKQQLTQINDTVKQFNARVRVDTSFSKSIDWDSLLFVVPDEERQGRTTAATNVPSSPNLYNSSGHSQILESNDNMSTHYQQIYSSPSILRSSAPQRPARPPPSYINNTRSPPYYTNTQLPSYNANSRTSSGSRNSRPVKYQCVCCKTVNTIDGNGSHKCSTCRSPAPF